MGYLALLLSCVGLMLIKAAIVDSGCVPLHIDICIALDSSASIANRRYRVFDEAKEGLKNTVDSLNMSIGPKHGEMQVAVVTYGEEVAVPIMFEDHVDKAALYNAMISLQRVAKYQKTRTDLGFKKCLELFQQKSGPSDGNKVIISVTDGIVHPGNVWTDFHGILSNVRAENISVIAVGVSGRKPVMPSSLLRQANNLSFHVVSNYNALSQRLTNINEKKQHCECMPSCLFGECDLDTLKCVCPIGRTGDDCGEEICPNPDPVDMCLVVDTSSSVKKHHFNTLKSALAGFGSKLNVGPDGGQFRVAAVTFGNNSEIPFTLDDHSTTESLAKALKKIKRVASPGKTRTNLGLLNCAQILTDQGRDAAMKVIIVFTDGRVSPASTDLRPSIQAVRDTGADVIVLGIGSTLDTNRAQRELTRIALGDSSNVFLTPTFEHLTKTLNDIVIEIEEIICSEW